LRDQAADLRAQLLGIGGQVFQGVHKPGNVPQGAVPEQKAILKEKSKTPSVTAFQSVIRARGKTCQTRQ
jgi:hypothetical protein